MKTISGKVVSSNPISVSKAAKIMFGFSAVDNGASDAVRVYLKRTSDAFNNLVQFHKELRTQISHRKGNISQPNVSDVKTETLADTGEIPEKKKKVQKRKKIRDLEASQLATLKIEEKRNQIGLNNEGAEVIDQGANESSGRKEKKKDRKERKQSEEKIENEDGSGVKRDKKKRKRSEDEVVEKSLEEDVKVENVAEAVDEGVKRDKKKKRKRSEDEVGEKSLEEDVKAENVGEAVDEGNQDGKKKRKKRKI